MFACKLQPRRFLATVLSRRFSSEVTKPVKVMKFGGSSVGSSEASAHHTPDPKH